MLSQPIVIRNRLEPEQLILRDEAAVCFPLADDHCFPCAPRCVNLVVQTGQGLAAKRPDAREYLDRSYAHGSEVPIYAPLECTTIACFASSTMRVRQAEKVPNKCGQTDHALSPSRSPEP
jgi:hypothetical protein